MNTAFKKEHKRPDLARRENFSKGHWQIVLDKSTQKKGDCSTIEYMTTGLKTKAEQQRKGKSPNRSHAG